MTAERGPERLVAERPEAALGRALLLTGAVWLVLAGTGWLAAPLGQPAVALLGFSLATLLVLGVRKRRAPARARTPRGAGLLLAAAGGFAGMAGAQMLLCLEGGPLAWEPAGRPLAQPLRASDVLATWLAFAVLGPVFEEVLYRERMLGALRTSAGPWAAALGSSLLYALPHGEPLAVAGAFGFGLVLAWAMLRTRSLLVCVGMHAGANVAWLSGDWICGTFGIRPGLFFASAAIALTALAATPRCVEVERRRTVSSRRECQVEGAS
jgi:membrane protease YdiL (CAAX protease family)